METRIACTALRCKIAGAEEAAALIRDGMTVAFGGYSSSGYPKTVAMELVRRKRAGEPIQIRVLTGANDGPLDTILGEDGLVSWRAPMIESKVLAQQANAGTLHYVEQQMSKMPRLLQDGVFGKIDVAVVEALRITADGGLVLTSSVGLVPRLLALAESVIVEINMAQPLALEGLHDIYLPEIGPNRQPIPMTGIRDRIGTPTVHVDPQKIRFIVRSDIPDQTAPLAASKPEILRICDNLLNFLELERHRFPGGKLPPFQTGFGNMASEVVKGLGRSSFRNISFFCGGLQEANMELLASDRAEGATAGAIQMTPRVMELLNEHARLYRERLVLRNGELTNCAELVGRMGLIALNSGVEMDIYGNVNSSHISGAKVVNGLGGGAGFAENAGLSVMLLPSESKQGALSTIVPMVSHQDISEHDIDIVITENGVADLRGKDDLQRAQSILENCVGEHYRDQMHSYLERAKRAGGHHPHLLNEAFSWHLRLKETGSMRELSEK